MAFDGSRAQLYRSRAEELRKLVPTLRDDDVKEQLRMVAEEYEMLARQAERGPIHH